MKKGWSLLVEWHDRKPDAGPGMVRLGRLSLSTARGSVTRELREMKKTVERWLRERRSGRA